MKSQNNFIISKVLQYVVLQYEIFVFDILIFLSEN